LSGAGKSSLVSLLLRFWDPTQGQITLGGVDLRSLDAAALRRALAVVPQRAYLFNASIRDNLRLAAPDASQEVMLSACRKARLEEFINNLPQGLDTWVGEDGVRLSAGERQRLALAQALLKDAPILVLDEPAANLDAETEKLILQVLSQALDEKQPGQAVLTISHRLAGLENYAEILVFHQGRVAERGTFQELVAQRGLFWQLYQLESDTI